MGFTMDSEAKAKSRQWAGDMARYGIASSAAGGVSTGVWKVAIDAYYWDRLEQAHDLALELGVAYPWQEWFYRLIEAEAVTRETSVIHRLDPQLTLELIPAEIPHSDAVGQCVLYACNDIKQRFAWPEGADTMVSILAEESNAPWTVGRAGYMMDKYPFDKICIPRSATASPNGLASVILHEFAHVMVLNLSEGLASTWLHEAVTMVAQHWRREADWSAFVKGSEPWLPPAALNAAFNDQHDPRLAHARSLAYSQSAALGFFLQSIGGEPKMGQLLRAFADNSNWTELRMTLTGQSPADEALRQVYGFGEKDLFARAKAWLDKPAPQ